MYMTVGIVNVSMAREPNKCTFFSRLVDNFCF